MATKGATLDDIRRDLPSPDPETRGRAMQALGQHVRKNPSLGPMALPIFQAAVANEPDAWTATSAIRGVEHLLGPDAARPAWRLLLERPDAVFAHRLALAAVDASHVRMLLELFAARPEPVFRNGVLWTLGRSHDPQVFMTLVASLEDPDLYVAAIGALGDFGDARALPLLENLRGDRRPSGQTDDRGWPLEIGDTADAAIRQVHQTMNASATPPAKSPESPAARPPPLPYWRRMRTLVAFLPLAIALFEIPWALGVFVVMYAIAKDRRPPLPESADYVVEIVWMVPVVLGVGIALAMLARWRRWGHGQRIVIAAGGGLCGLMVLGFVRVLLAL